MYKSFLGISSYVNGLLSGTLYGVYLSLNEAFILRVTWWWCYVFDIKTWKKIGIFYPIEFWSIVPLILHLTMK